MMSYIALCTMSAVMSNMYNNEALNLKPLYHFTRAANEMNGKFSFSQFAIGIIRNNSQLMLLIMPAISFTSTRTHRGTVVYTVPTMYKE